MKILFSLMIVFVGATYTTDVTSQNIIYHSNKRTEKPGMTTMDLNRILIKGKSKLEWQDGHGIIKHAFDIENVEGSLSLYGSGQIMYQVISEKVNGRFIVKKTESTVNISAMLVSENMPVTVEFEITSHNVIK